MNSQKLVSIAVTAALAVAVPAGPALAGGPAAVVPVAVSTAQEERAVRVLVAQSEIKSDINSSNLGIVMGGGLLGGLMAAAQNSSREKKAEELIGPLRTALIDLDIDAMAQSAARSGIAAVPWLSGAAVSFGKDSSPVGKSEFLDSNTTPRVTFVEYTYDLSPNFDSIRVVATSNTANKALPVVPKSAKAPKPEDRLKPKNLAYAQSVTVAVLLPNADPKNKEANAAAWAANNGELARKGLAQAFAEVAALTPRTFALTDADIKAMGDKTRARAGYEGLQGRVVE
jgi:hypothetical protein